MKEEEEEEEEEEEDEEEEEEMPKMKSLISCAVTSQLIIIDRTFLLRVEFPRSPMLYLT